MRSKTKKTEFRLRNRFFVKTPKIAIVILKNPSWLPNSFTLDYVLDSTKRSCRCKTLSFRYQPVISLTGQEHLRICFIDFTRQCVFKISTIIGICCFIRWLNSAFQYHDIFFSILHSMTFTFIKQSNYFDLSSDDTLCTKNTVDRTRTELILTYVYIHLGAGFLSGKLLKDSRSFVI